MSEPRILIAGIGNIFFGDDAFGVEVVHSLMNQSLPEGVRVIDFGIRGLDLAYALLENYDAVILVDAAPRGDVPGSLYLLEPELSNESIAEEGTEMINPHSLDPWKVLKMAKSLGGQPKRIYVIGCEPQLLDTDEFIMELSAPVRAAIAEAIPMIVSQVNKLRVEILSENLVSEFSH